MAEFDLSIIGGGPGGYVAAIRAAQLGKKVALIEKERVGGLCLNWGCIPSKALLWNAEVVRLVNDAATYGITFDNLNVDMEKAIERSRGIVDQMVKGVEFLLNKNGVRVVQGSAAFETPNRLRVSGPDVLIESKNTIVATGVRPRELPGLKTDGETIIGSREALVLTERPESVGGSATESLERREGVRRGGPKGPPRSLMWLIQCTVHHAGDHHASGAHARLQATADSR